MMKNANLKKILWGAAGVVTLAGGTFICAQILAEDRYAKKSLNHILKVNQSKNRRPKQKLPTRNENIASLKNKEYDVLIIGGGATGSGCALDSITRGLSTALVELDDFGSGTSSRSTKLIHGGVRYLQKAIMNFDYEQYKMVEEALHERDNLLQIAPHLSFPLPIMLPVYKYWQIPYFWAGIKMYDFVSGDKCLKASYYLNKEGALEQFPMLKNDSLKGAIVYYDGTHNDARMNLSIALTAARLGATLGNHIKVTDLVKNENGKVVGANVTDQITKDSWTIKAKCVINATGPFTDSIRKMDNNAVIDIVKPSSGVHIVLPEYYSPKNMGLLDPQTSDGRVIFFLPWQGLTIAGTTDSPCEITHSPAPTEREIQFILNEVKNYLTPDIEVRRGDVLSAWSGIRPLVLDPNKKDTQSLVRNHVIHVSESGLITIAGGKWTTYRSMALETLDKAVEACHLSPKRDSQTDGLLLEGGHTWTPTSFIALVQDLGVDTEVAKHLSNTYGDRAFSVGKMAQLTGHKWPIVGKKLHPEFPYIEAEVRYAIREYALTPIDVIARRLRLSFLNVQAAEEVLPRVVEIMAEELMWSESERIKQMEDSLNFLRVEMGKDVNKHARQKIRIDLSENDINHATKSFNLLDRGSKGYVSINDIRASLKKQGANLTGEQVHSILSELDTNENGKVELDEYLLMITAIKEGLISHSRLARVAQKEVYTSDHKYGEKMERSGGGV
nr:probable glycerol-3-phosphate dehydrogenase, mitochondrial [Lepeophtheirus salmonis]